MCKSKISVVRQGATLVDQIVSITPVENYIPIHENDMQVSM